MTSLPDQWKYLNALAEEKRKQGDMEHCRKLLDCAATIKDLWIEAHAEMVNLISDNSNNLVDWNKATTDEYRMFATKRSSVFENA